MDVETNLDMDLSDLFDLTDTPGEGPKDTEAKPEEKTQENPEEEIFKEEEMLNLGPEKSDPDEEIEKPHSPEKETESSSSPNHWVIFAKSLEESGLISEFEEDKFEELVKEAGSPAEAIIALADQTIQKTIEEHINAQDAEYQEFVRMRDSGVDMGQYAKVSKQAREYDKYSIENVRNDVDLQKEVVREDLRLKGMDRDEIEDLIESLEDTNKLSKKAESAVANLGKFKEAQLQRLQEEAARSDREREDATKKQLESYQKFVEDSKEIIPGVKLNKQKKDKLFDMIVKPSETYNGQPVNALTAKMLKDPVKFNYTLAALIDAGVFDGKWDNLIKVGKSKAIEDLAKAVETGVQFKPGAQEKGAYANMYKDLKELNKKV